VTLPGPMSLAFLAYLGLLLPLGARRTAALLRGQHPARPAPSREQIWRSALFVQAILVFLAWFTGSGFGFRMFAMDDVTPLDVGAALVALVLLFGLRSALRRLRSEDELRQLEVFRRAPRTRREIGYYTLAVLVASVAEEAAYRGVGWTILIYMFGDPWSTALVMACVFALAHWSQGWKSGVAIVGMALVFHGLVALTGTLVLAMLVHASYDLVAGRAIRKQALELDAQDAARRQGPRA
jgi:membrane protease YdiL (CAAX protease family)